MNLNKLLLLNMFFAKPSMIFCSNDQERAKAEQQIKADELLATQLQFEEYVKNNNNNSYNNNSVNNTINQSSNFEVFFYDCIQYKSDKKDTCYIKKILLFIEKLSPEYITKENYQKIKENYKKIIEIINN